MRDSGGKFLPSSVEGVGILDVDKRVKELGKPYSTWRGMLMRCYSKAYQNIQTTYVGCHVCDEWKVYSSFERWFNDNYQENFELDKDLLGDGKLYSPDTCCYLPKEINLALPKKKTRGAGYTGIRFNGYSWTAQLMWVDSKIKHVGSFKTEIEDLESYIAHKDRYMQYLANKYKNILSTKVYEELLNFNTGNHISKLYKESL